MVFPDSDRIRVEQFKRATQEKLRQVRCPEHHQSPRVRFQGNSLRDITVSLSGCCAKVMEIANARIGSLRAQNGMEPASPCAALNRPAVKT